MYGSINSQSLGSCGSWSAPAVKRGALFVSWRQRACAGGTSGLDMGSLNDGIACRRRANDCQRRDGEQWQRVLGTPAVLIGVCCIAIAPLTFTGLPVMQHLLQTRSIDFGDGLVIVGLVAPLLIILEVEKQLGTVWLGAGGCATAHREGKSR
jgi:hypothetical protein